MNMQQEFHAYRGNDYVGICVATPEQLSDLGLTAGDAPSLDISVLRAQAISAMVARIEAFTSKFTAGYPKEEVAAWPNKAIGADVVLAGGQSSVVAAEALERGLSDVEAAEKIAAKSAAYLEIIGTVSGLRQSVQGAILAAETAEAVEAALLQGLARAQEVAAARGLEF